MASKDSLEMRELAQKLAVQVSRDDTPVAIRLRKRTAGAVTSVTVTTATNIVMITADGGTDTYAFATYTTVGALADAIAADGIFEVVVLDALRADATDGSQFVTGAITAGNDENGVVVWDVKVDTSVTDYMSAALSLHRNFDVNGAGHRVIAKELQYNVNISSAEANAARVYLRTKNNVETQIYGIASVDATLTTISWASGNGGITAPEDATLIFRIFDTTSITDAAGNYVQISGIIQ